MATTFEIFCALLAVAAAVYYYFVSTFDFWKLRGVAGPKPIPLFGNTKRLLLGQIYIGDYLREVYNLEEYKNEPMVGIFTRRTPILLMKDPALIKDILIKDFSKFASRGQPTFKKIEPLTQHLFSLEPEKWKPLRTKLSPVFTSGKMKEMFNLIMECADHLEIYLDKLVTKGEPVDCRDVAAKFTTDVIGCCAFGLDTKSLSDEDSEFREMGKAIFAPTLLNTVKARMRVSVPKFYEMLGYIFPPDKVTIFFRNLIMDTIAYRTENGIVRNDFVNTLMDLKNNPQKLDHLELTDDLIAAQAFVFFVAGFDTSSTTISQALYELALNPTIQDKLREEIREHYKKYGEQLKYENIKEMVYLDQVFRETLRKYPPLSVIMRKAMEDYTFEGTKISIPKGTRVWIPSYAFHWDPAIYPDPDVFKPERFSEEVAATRHPMHYLPFGDGPRNCIGARFAVYQSKVGLIKTLRRYKFEVCEKTRIPFEKHPNVFLLAPLDGINLKVKKIDEN